MRRFQFAVAIALLAGCSSSTSGLPFGGTYDLLSINGLPDPQPPYVGASTEVVSGTLSVGADTLHLTLELQALDNTGHPTGDTMPVLGAIPYVRHGDSLLVPADTSSAGWGDALFIGGEEPGAPQPIGAIVGSDVRLNLLIGAIPASTGFSGSVSHFLFTPAR